MNISYDRPIDLAEITLRKDCENHSLIPDKRSHRNRLDGKPLIRTALIKIKDFAFTINA